MMTKARLNIVWLRFWFLAPFFLQGFTLAGLLAWTQSHPQAVVGVCPSHPQQLISQNRALKN